MLKPVLRRSLPLFLGLLVLPAAAPAGDGTGFNRRILNGFGRSVAVSGRDVLVGEPSNSSKPGIVYVYRRNAQGAWAEASQITATGGTPGDGFGTAMAVQPNRLFVSAVSDATGRGTTFVFERDAGGAWKQAGRIEAPTDTAATLFGYGLAVDGDDLLIAAPLESGTGAVHAYHRDAAGQWQHTGRLVPANPQENGAFGVAVSLSGGHALVASPATGVTAFRSQSGVWGAIGDVVPESGPVPQFGRALGFRNGLAVIGSPAEGNGAGTVRLYRFDEAAEAWTPAGSIAAPDSTRQLFGATLAVGGDAVWVGAIQANGGRGAAFAYRQEPSGEWILGSRLAPSGEGSRDAFGGALAAGDGIAVVGMTGADFGAGRAAIYEAATGAVAWTESATVMSEVESLPAVTGGEVRCASSMATGFGCGQVDLLAFLPIKDIGGARGVELNDIWGWTDPQSGREYALVGRVNGTSFVDISDPVKPVYVGDLPMTAGSQPNAWRDIKVYRDHAFVVADGAGPHGVQVFDLTKLREFKDTPLTFAESAHYDRIASAHNIVINEESGFAYAVGSSMGGETCGGGLHMIDIRDPSKPTFAGCFADPQTGRSGTGYSHDAQCVMYHGPDADYRDHEICIGLNETMLSVADVTDKQHPMAVTRVGYPNVGYTHQGWFTEDQKYFFVDDELDEMNGLADHTRTLVWDMSDLDDPQLVKEFFGTTEASDHNLYIRGHFVYQSDYAAGLRILDISDPTSPVEVGFFDTQPVGENKPAFTGSWSNYPFFRSGVIAVSSIEQGLFLLRYRPGRPVSD
jgi:choice-of-anchor B domain-containing protein